MTRCVIDAVVQSGVCAILSKGWSDRLHVKVGEASEPEEPLPPQIYPINSVPHDWLFKRIDAACHHGGAGTTGASLRGKQCYSFLLIIIHVNLRYSWHPHDNSTFLRRSILLGGQGRSSWSWYWSSQTHRFYFEGSLGQGRHGPEASRPCQASRRANQSSTFFRSLALLTLADLFSRKMV